MAFVQVRLYLISETKRDHSQISIGIPDLSEFLINETEFSVTRYESIDFAPLKLAGI